MQMKIARWWTRAWTSAIDGARAQDAASLAIAGGHAMRLTARRAVAVVARVRLLALAFAVLTPLWGIAEYATLAADARLELAPVAVLASIAFAAVLVLAQGAHTLEHAYRGLLLFFAVLGAFFLYCYLHSLHRDADGVLDGVAAGYAYLPFVMLAAMGVFPLTLAECGVITGLVFGVQFVAWLPGSAGLGWITALTWCALLVLFGALATLASIAQLDYLTQVVRDGLHDRLTGCYSRRAGEELFELMFAWCGRSGADLAIAMIFLDRFQDLNERHGYEAGDAALKDITVRLHDAQRSGDLMIRWTGDSFLLAMPMASREQAAGAVERLLASGLGVDPAGAPLTASIGIADRVGDRAQDGWSLVDAASSRAAAAREAGGNRTVAG